jgi:hypothetical protein
VPGLAVELDLHERLRDAGVGHLVERAVHVEGGGDVVEAVIRPVTAGAVLER